MTLDPKVLEAAKKANRNFGLKRAIQAAFDVADLVERSELDRAEREVEQCHAKAACCCGDYMKGHSAFSEHSPKSMYDYALELMEGERDEVRRGADGLKHMYDTFRKNLEEREAAVEALAETRGKQLAALREALVKPTPAMIQARIDRYPNELRIREADLEVWRDMARAAAPQAGEPEGYRERYKRELLTAFPAKPEPEDGG